MSDHDTITPETNDEIRARLRAFAQEVIERTDTEAALQRMPRGSRPPTSHLMAVAACFILAVAIAAVVMTDRRQPLDTGPADSPTNTTDCPSTLGACIDDGPTTLARGVVEFVEVPAGEGCCVPPGGGLAGQTLEITAVEEDGEVTGEARFNGIVVEFECADTTAPHGVVVLGGKVMTSSGDGTPSVGALIAVIVREGEPDSATVWPEEHQSCPELFQSIPVPWSDYFESFVDVVDGDDIETS